MNKTKTLLSLFSAVSFVATSASGELLVYEGFDYGAAGEPLDAYTSVGTEPVGLAGTGTGQWTDADSATHDSYLKSGSLSFSNLATSGNHIGYENNNQSDRYNRGLETTGFSSGSIYFSFLFEKLQSNFGADREGFAVMNQVAPQARWDSGNSGAIGLEGFAVAAVDGSNLQAVGYDGTSGTRTVSGGSVPITVVNGGSNTSISNVAVNFIVGEISFNTGTGGADVFSLYNFADDGSLDTSALDSNSDATLIDTIEFDMDESTLNTLNLTRQVNVNYDEVRIGTTLGDVLVPVPEASTFTLLGLSGLFLLRRRRRS
ncbi:hypothetical protein [Coraliomargarita sinensis]|nr:hypothetical protein [Coraliomargarita sinensis]